MKNEDTIMENEIDKIHRTYDDGRPWLPCKLGEFRSEGDLTGSAAERLAMYKALLKMEPVQAALLLKSIG